MAAGHREPCIWQQQSLFKGKGLVTGARWCSGCLSQSFRPVMPHLWSKCHSCWLWRQIYSLMSINQILCVSAKLRGHHSHPLWTSLAHLTSLFWCCFVAMVTKCYSMRHNTVYMGKLCMLIHITPWDHFQFMLTDLTLQNKIIHSMFDNINSYQLNLNVTTEHPIKHTMAQVTHSVLCKAYYINKRFQLCSDKPFKPSIHW